MKKKFLFYAMRGQKMCFLHVLMNAVDLDKSGYEVKIVFEGEAVTLPPVLADEKNPLYQKCLELGLIAGVCKGCASTLGVLDKIEALDLPLMTDMNGHAGVKPFIEQGYQVAVF